MERKEDETELPDLNVLADKNMFAAGEESNQGENHPEGDLPPDNSISYQDPNERLEEGLG